MAKKFLVAVDLGNNNLVNASIATGSIIKASAKVENASSAPSAAGAGSLYYNTSGALFYATGSGTGNWVQLATGSSAVSSVNSITGSITISGTTNQVTVTNGSGTITLSTPQDIATTSKPQFAAIGIGTSAPTAGAAISGGKTVFAAPAAGYASVILTPAASDPTTLAAGDLWVNNTSTPVLKFSTTTLAGGVKTVAFTDSTMTGVWNGTIITSAYGGTGNGFTKFSGPTTSEKTFTLPNASATILTDNAAVTVAQGGTGLSSLTQYAIPYASSTSAFTQQAIGSANQIFTVNATANGYAWVNASGLSVSSAATLTTPRAIYGNNFDGSAALTQVIASTYGGTGNGFTKFSGPTTSEKTFTLPNASATILTDNAAVTVAQGGTGATTFTSGGILRGNGTSAISVASASDITTAIGSTAVTNATNATNTAITDDTSSSTGYITWVGATSGNNGQKVTSTKLTFDASTGNLVATKFNGLTISTSTGTLTIANGKTATINETMTLTAGAAGQTFTLPSSTDTIVGRASTDTLTNKTLTSPTINGATMTGTITVPTPVNGTDAANKNYVDNVASGVNAHDAVQYATTTTIAGTYAAGSAGADGGTGVGATITYTSTGTTSIDSGANLALNDRVLVKNGVTADAGTTSKANGIYYVTTAGTTGVATVLTRALDADNSIAGDIMAGDLVYIVGGGQGGTQWIQTATGTATTPVKGIKIGTDSITFTQFSGASSTTAGAGLVANGNAFDVGTASSARIVVNSDNIDLATVSQTNTTGTAGINFVQSHTVDSYGRVTGTVSADVRDATTSVKGIASFSSSHFTVTSGAVSLSANTISGVALGSNLNALSYGTGLTNTSGASTYNGSSTSTIGFASGTTAAGANDVGSSYTYATQKATATLTGTGSKSSWTISHNLNSRDIQVQVYQTSATPDTQYAEVEVDIVRTAAGTVTVTFASAPALNDTYNVVMVG